MKTSQIFLFALLCCTSVVFSQSYSGTLTHTNGYFTIEPFNASYDDGSSARLFYDGNNRRIQFWNTGTTPYTHINVGDVVANGDLEAIGNITATGNLGIGTATPSASLEISNPDSRISVFTDDSHQPFITLGMAQNDRWGLGSYEATNSLHPRTFFIYEDHTGANGSNGVRLAIKPDGNVGVGTMTPNEKLDINGNVLVDRMVKIDGHGSVASLQIMDNSDTGTPDVILRGDGGDSYIKAGGFGIGTMDTGTYKLAVNGNVRAKEVRVETGWSDFVFEKDYGLPSLEEVEEHIKNKGHLKDIPSAEEVAENGILLGEMDSKLLQKIEELTLYTIAQEKRIKHLEKENETLKFITERVAKIEALVKTK